MRKIAWVFGLLCFASFVFAGVQDDPDIILRGDANHDSQIDGSDIVTIAKWLFNGGPEPPCLNEADTNNDGDVDISDATYLSNYLYSGGPPPPPPGTGECTEDDEPFPGCANICWP
jgi:hypothetical protein